MNGKIEFNSDSVLKPHPDRLHDGNNSEYFTVFFFSKILPTDRSPNFIKCFPLTAQTRRPTPRGSVDSRTGLVLSGDQRATELLRLEDNLVEKNKIRSTHFWWY